jgi:hypothetical protein
MQVGGRQEVASGGGTANKRSFRSVLNGCQVLRASLEVHRIAKPPVLHEFPATSAS